MIQHDDETNLPAQPALSHLEADALARAVRVIGPIQFDPESKLYSFRQGIAQKAFPSTTLQSLADKALQEGVDAGSRPARDRIPCGA